MKPFQVGLLGAGVVGGGTFAVLQRNQEEIRRRAGREIRIGHVVDVDLDRARRVAGDAAEVGSDARALIARPEIDAVIELIGGTGIARTLVLEAIGADLGGIAGDAARAVEVDVDDVADADLAAGAAPDLLLVALQDREGAAADDPGAEQADLERLHRAATSAGLLLVAWRAR